MARFEQVKIGEFQVGADYVVINGPVDDKILAARIPAGEYKGETFDQDGRPAFKFVSEVGIVTFIQINDTRRFYERIIETT